MKYVFPATIYTAHAVIHDYIPANNEKEAFHFAQVKHGAHAAMFDGAIDYDDWLHPYCEIVGDIDTLHVSRYGDSDSGYGVYEGTLTLDFNIDSISTLIDTAKRRGATINYR